MKSIGAAVIGLCKYIGTSPYTAAIKEIAQTITGTWSFLAAPNVAISTAGTALTLTSTDAGSSTGPNQSLFRDSASPLAGDFLSHIQYFGRDSAANVQLYAGIYAQIIDPTSTSEDSLLGFRTVAAGSSYDWAIQSGAWFAQTATGGAKAAGTINATGYYLNGVSIEPNITSATMILQDQKASTTDGGTATSGSWQTRTLNTTVVNTITGASVLANVVTLPAGTFDINWSAPAYKVGAHQTRWRNTADSTSTLGSSEYTQASIDMQTRSMGSTRITIAAPKTFELQHQVGATFATEGYGRATGFETEVYSIVTIRQVA